MSQAGADSWSSLLSVASSVFLFALATQCALAWIFAFLFLSFVRQARTFGYFLHWTRAWIARGIALTVILARFMMPIADGNRSETINGSLFSVATFAVYQTGKFLAFWWLLEGVLAFAGTPVSRRWSRGVLVAAVAVGIVSALAVLDIEGLLIVQAPAAVVAGLASAVILLRVPPEQRSAGTRLTAAALLLQALLWCAYAIALSRSDPRAWPLEQSPWAMLAAHNSYFDLALDVMVASGLTVLLLQDAHRYQHEAERERNRLHAELERTERLRSLGTLVSGVAHELNNPLTAILGFAETLSSSESDPDRMRQANVIREQALRCRRIVQGLSTFSGRGSQLFEPVEIGALLERVRNGFEFELVHRQVTLRVETPGPVRLVCDRFAIEQMVTNLLSNALHASPAGGQVHLRVRNGEKVLVLTVEDEGVGFDPAVLSRIFDPFFTTRQPGEGMGLGLAVVHGIVRAHRGSISATNRVPHGACVSVSLPHTTDASAEHQPLPVRDVPRPPRSAAPLELLVIEDEPLLCEMMMRVGKLRGWSVSVARTGSQGMERLQDTAGRFDVVLCDIRMPAPSGIEIHDRLAAKCPELIDRFLFVTGDPHAEDVHRFARRCTRPILSKPFDTGALAVQIEELASRPATQGAGRG